ncbi:hypothetical protein ELE18_07060 [Klebsiella quasipneumoniae]|uniref:hypothetical protein n=1 Tax=Klebsiella quasipneumoniae TaxID=1463165 RepID=UPI000F89DC93|nr:hypothetical protein [Klebsiella quasipneumoniae]AZR62139.1 hypothetical protein ELE18_07060 [Klebsiella quasipneumoniae]HCM6593128.1 hypothetical protein [Klebsiella quasipneumoniae]
MNKVDVEKLVPVYLLKISSIEEYTESRKYVLSFEPGQDITDQIIVNEEYINRYSPKVGGYYIMCSNGVGMYSE